MVHRLTVITVTFNSERTLERTIRSVRGQVTATDQVEHIIVDGGSTDSTVDVIKKWAIKGAVSQWVSEPDAGIYDAMNKGIAMATGDYLCMLNSDDELAEGALDRCVAAAKENPLFFYGDEFHAQADGSRTAILAVPGMIMRQVFCSHQALWVRRDVAAEIGNYRTDIGLAADYEYMIRLWEHSGPGLHVNHPLCIFHPGGATTSQRETYHQSQSQVSLRHIEALRRFAQQDEVHGLCFLHGWSGRLLNFVRGGCSNETERRWLEITGREIGFACRAPVVTRWLFSLTFRLLRTSPKPLKKITIRPPALLLHFLTKAGYQFA